MCILQLLLLLLSLHRVQLRIPQVLLLLLLLLLLLQYVIIIVCIACKLPGENCSYVYIYIYVYSCGGAQCENSDVFHFVRPTNFLELVHTYNILSYYQYLSTLSTPLPSDALTFHTDTNACYVAVVVDNSTPQ